MRVVNCALVALLLCCVCADEDARALQIGLHASWAATSVGGEAAAWIASTAGNDTAWRFMLKLTTADADPVSAAEAYKRIDAAAEAVLPTRAAAVLRWAVAARVMSPRAAAHAATARQTLAQFPTAAAEIVSKSDAFAIRINGNRGTLLKKVDEELATAQSPSFVTATATDHVLLPSCADASTLLLYADVSTNAFAKWLAYARSECIRVVLRHWHARDAQPVALQGYAVHVAVKATEYHVVDDRVFVSLFPDAPHGAIASSLAAEDASVDLKAFEAPFAALAIAEQIRGSANGDPRIAVRALRTIVDNAPVELARIVDGYDATITLRRATRRLSDVIGGALGRSDTVFVNGRALPVSTAVAQSLPSTLRCLACLSGAAAALEKIGATRNDIAALLHIGTVADDAPRLRVQFADAQEITVWYNDLSRDSRYQAWDRFANHSYVRAVDARRDMSGKDVGSLVKVRANLLELVIALDPGDPQQIAYLSLPEQIVHGGIPLRTGVILVPNDDVSTMVVAAFHYLRLGRGKKAAVGFLGGVTQIMEYIGAGFQKMALSPQIVEIAYQRANEDAGGSLEYPTVASIVESNEEVNTLIRSARAWAHSMGLFKAKSERDAKGVDNNTQAFSMVSTMNGILIKDLISETLTTAFKEQRRIASTLEADETDGDEEEKAEPPTWVENDSSLVVVKRVSKSLLTSQPRDFLAATVNTTKRLSFAQLQQAIEEWTNIDYPSHKQVQTGGAVTLWLTSCGMASKFEKAKEVVELFAARPFTKKNNVRIAYLSATSAITKLVTSCNNDADTVFLINGQIVPATEISSPEDLETEVALQYLSKASKFGAHQHSPSVNGWDAALLASAAIREVDEACVVSSGTGDGPRPDALETVLTATEEQAEVEGFVFPSSKKLREEMNTNPLTVVAVCDPLGKYSSATLAFLDAIDKAFGNSVFSALVLAPHVGVHEEVPKSRQVFSRFLLSPVQQFEDGFALPPSVVFDKLPQEHILTVDVKQPRSWFIASYSTNYDMDNVVLSSLPSHVRTLYAQYELQSLLVEGSCVDEDGVAPQGLQVKMSSTGLDTVDTLVMANLGYFQLRVPKPGQWAFSLAPGRSADIFNIKSIDSRLSAMYGTSGSAEHTFSASDSGIEVVVDSLDGACGTLLKVERKPGMEGQMVLDAKKSAVDLGKLRAVFRNVGSLISGALNRSSEGAGDTETINVFSVASGHLYERFLKIMMLSVSKHASRPVKFWLLENYLSPSFKKMLRHFAKERGFEVGLVTYRWPGWLREQSEKQRIIWAYKILYLDVLFPLNVKRIIFVDSDQVVRADLAELMDMDLGGAPYGYTPFCDSRKEVDGYRFWKSGFWKNTLGERKYHISALYVVDLQRMRENASGDKLRAMYQSLSSDPNSLSNLDQDLPNYAAAVGAGASVPIFELPQEWLWCESWCDDESKKTAKTIDLCNNPMTKEPKLESAKRIIGEWTSLDDEATSATKRIYAKVVGGEGTPSQIDERPEEKTSEDYKEEL